MNRITARLAVLAVALVALVAACGDDSGSPFGSSTIPAGGSTTTAAGASTTGGAGEETTTTAEGETDTSQVGQSGEVEDLLQQFRQSTLRTTYVMEDDQEITFSQDPSQDPPVSAVLYEGGKMITAGESYIVCSGEGEGAMCFTVPGTEGMDMATAFLGPFASLALSLQEGMTGTPGYEVETEQATVASRSGVCFTYSPDAALATGYEYIRTCVDSELGFTLLVQVQESSATEVKTVMELVSFGDPEPGDFEPTGPVTEVPEG
jgi:hypothetical protein